jgi:hypothetical protein
MILALLGAIPVSLFFFKILQLCYSAQAAEALGAVERHMAKVEGLVAKDQTSTTASLTQTL